MSIGQIILIIISGLGVFHGLFLTILLWTTKTTNNISNKLLGVMMIIFSIRVGKSVVLAFTENLQTIYIYLGLCLMMFIGPLFLLYNKAVLNKDHIISKKEWLHFLPGIILMGFAIPMQIVGFRNIPAFIAIFLYLAIYLQFLGYVVYVKLKIIRHAESSPEVIAWLNILYYGLLAIWLEYVLNLFEERIPYILGPIVYSVTVYFITYLAFKNKYLTLINTVKYKTAGVSENESAELFTALENLMQNEKIFLDPNLTLALIGKRLKVSNQKLSMTINSRSNSNFNEYVNKYRVEHAKGILKDANLSNLSIAAIAYDSGFNSLSSFNGAFKKNTGKTPSAFRNA